MNIIWHSESSRRALEALRSAEHGLTRDEARKRLLETGPNRLPEEKVPGVLSLFLRQFTSPLIFVLLLASLVVYLMGETVDAAVIAFVLFFNAIIGAVQEGKAEHALAALKRLTTTNAIVVRDGLELLVPAEELVPGDVIVLNAGDQIPADARLLHANGLKIIESALTGESEPVEKNIEEIAEERLPYADQHNMVFKGTLVASGLGRAVVVATGTSTVIGQISEKISHISTDIPLKREIDRLSYIMVAAVAVLSVLLFVIGVGLGREPREMFVTTVALAVSVIPEGLPVVMTLVLALGVWRMGKRHALVKKLQAVEALGQATVIAVDKTGTLTRNEMVVQKIYVGGRFFSVTGEGYNPQGEIQLAGATIDPANHAELLLLGKLASFCANARVAFEEGKASWLVSGDPTEAALLVLGEKIGFHKADLEAECLPLGEIPFDHDRKYHATLHNVDGKGFVTVVGAPENVVGLSNRSWSPEGEQAMSEESKQRAAAIVESLSAEGYRVLAVAIKQDASPGGFEGSSLKDLVFVGFYAIRDGLRPEVPEAMARAKQAGVKVVMITGDYPTTAAALAREAGIYRDGDTIVTGLELETLSDEDLNGRLAQASVFARVTPEHKMRIIEAYRRRGEIVAMTGDGINDAPSLVAADLGVAMGRIGTEVAKEAADIVLLNDDFGSIISAIEEGRTIYRTIKKTLLYLISTSVGEVLVIAASLFLGYPLPVLAAQIIWLNLVTDGFLTLAWALEPKENDVLSADFRREHRLIDRSMLVRIAVMSVPMMVGTLWLFERYLDGDLVKAWTVSMTVLAVFQWFNAWNCRSERQTVFSRDILTNTALIYATLIVIFLQLLAVYTAPLQKVLQTTALSLDDWLLIVPVASSIILVEEVRKFLVRLYARRRTRSV
ncbi:MAG TPA: HAD-IC family P-type ATPase [Candidatus Paceibacterota bacterium]|nr:HAD-IC family P-type ATPase [Candidatus Paceibacterota bacterium]